MNAAQHIEAMAACATRMREAASRQDWEQLAELERNLVQMRDQARTGIDPARLTDAVERERILAMLRGILEDEQAIRAHIDPWMESTRKMLAQSTRARAMKSAYGQ